MTVLWLHTYWWLEGNNLWKAVVAFWVTLLLSAVVGLVLRPWQAFKRNREIQEKIADHLDTSTPGGITELIQAVKALNTDSPGGLSDVVEALYALASDLENGDAPDDNGSDDQRKFLHPHVHAGEHNDPLRGVNPLHGGPGHGGGGAAHR